MQQNILTRQNKQNQGFCGLSLPMNLQACHTAKMPCLLFVVGRFSSSLFIFL